MNKARTLLLIIASLLMAALLTRNGDLIWMALPFLAYLGIGLAQSPTVSDIRLLATRSVEKAATDGTSAIEVGVSVSNQGTTLVRLGLSDPLLAGMNLIDGQLKQSVALQAGESAVFKYTFRSERGSFAWKTIRAVVSDPFGLIEIQRDLPAEARIQVHPELNKFRPFQVWPQHTLHSAGSIPTRLGGSGTDFWGVREYHVGDPLRRIDWRLTARHPHQLFTKEFQQEEIADIGLILDARRKTDLRVGEDSLFEHAARATASLAEVFLRQGNRVGLLVYQRRMINLFPGYGKVQLNRILRTLAQVTPEEDSGLNSLLLMPSQLFSSHSLIVIISPLTPGDWYLFPRLRAYGHQVLLISPDPIDFARPTLPTDPVSQLASRFTQLERQMEMSNITRRWIPVIDWQVSQPLAPLVRNALKHAHIQRER